ncbi:hypothetical protein [Rhodococcus sp. NPDC058521]|uniref:hypothetical protein n=1 Tax=Rhodococcus sp. NPDC058521 TaxID=3346536 RepID=UPI00365AB635
MEDPVLGMRAPSNPTAQIIVPPRGTEEPRPHLGIDVGDPSAVDAAHAEVVRRGMRVVYPLTDEPWGGTALLRRGSQRNCGQCACSRRRLLT